MLDNPVLSPLDDRYKKYTKELSQYFSDSAINRARVKVEIEWLIYLLDNKVFDNVEQLDDQTKKTLRRIVEDFQDSDVEELNEIEKKTNHDVKAVEYYLKKRLPKSVPSEIVHVFLTSEDVNNIAYSLSLMNGVKEVWLPKVREISNKLLELSKLYKSLPLLALTHGQTATPTTLGKEIRVLQYRLERQIKRQEKQEFLGKFNGATGTYSAHKVSKPNVDWPDLNKGFVESLGLSFNPLTTQIESYDASTECFEIVSHFNRVLHNLATDIWTYISNDVFKLKAVEGETGSSTMPHKVNPINFENGEANLELANGIFKVLIDEFLTSRLQRDLTDSTLRRNIGVAFGYSMVAYSNILVGLNKLEANTDSIEQKLIDHPEVLAEAIQTVLRVASIEGIEGLENPYEMLKAFTRGKAIDKKGVSEFIQSLNLPTKYSDLLKNLEPKDYTGFAQKLAEF